MNIFSSKRQRLQKPEYRLLPQADGSTHLKVIVGQSEKIIKIRILDAEGFEQLKAIHDRLDEKRKLQAQQEEDVVPT